MGNLPYLPPDKYFGTNFAIILLVSEIEPPFPQAMAGASGAIILKRHSEIAVGSLFGVILLQGFGYGLIFDINFFLRNLSVVGGLLMVFSDSMVSRKSGFAGLPNLSDTDRRK